MSVKLKKTISTLEVRQKLGDILNRVALRHDEYIIERKGKPLAAVVPVEKLMLLEEAARSHALDLLSKQASELSEDEAMLLANEGKHRSRQRSSKTR